MINANTKKTSVSNEHKKVCCICGVTITSEACLYGLKNRSTTVYVHRECAYTPYTHSLQACKYCEQIISPYDRSGLIFEDSLFHLNCLIRSSSVHKVCDKCEGLITPYNNGCAYGSHFFHYKCLEKKELGHNNSDNKTSIKDPKK